MDHSVAELNISTSHISQTIAESYFCMHRVPASAQRHVDGFTWRIKDRAQAERIAAGDLTLDELHAAVNDLRNRKRDALAACSRAAAGTAEQRLAQSDMEHISDALEAAEAELKSRPGGSATQAHARSSPMFNMTRSRAPAPKVPTVADRFPGDPAHGFGSAGEFFTSVRKASAPGGYRDTRLILDLTTTGTEGTGADGGFAVPPEFAPAILSVVLGEDSLLSRTLQIPIKTNAITIPTDVTAPWQATGGVRTYWESEAGALTESKPELDGAAIKASKIITFVPVSDELIADAPAMGAYIKQKAPANIDYKVNDALINGTGVGQPLGILTSAGTVTVAAESGQTADTVIYDNVLNMYSRLLASSRRRAIWLANADIETQLLRMVAPGTNIPAYKPAGDVPGSPYGSLLGRPLIVTEAMPKLGDAGDLVLGDMSAYVSAVKTGGVRQDVSIHVFFDYDLVAFRFVLRIGGQPLLNTTIARTQSQTAQGFFIKLGAR